MSREPRAFRLCSSAARWLRAASEEYLCTRGGSYRTHWLDHATQMRFADIRATVRRLDACEPALRPTVIDNEIERLTDEIKEN